MNTTGVRSARLPLAARVLLAGAVCPLVGATFTGCLERPVVAEQPTLQTNFTSQVTQEAVTKVDLLFMIDNSASMGDKQAYLYAAVPDLVTRLVSPNCLDANGNVVGASDAQGQCPAGSHVEFPAVHDMHIGLISSSLGSRGGDVCLPNAVPDPPYAGISDHNDDQGHLLSRSLTVSNTGASEGVVSDAQSTGFLSWFPSVQQNQGATAVGTAITQAKQLETDFQSIVTGAGFFGCGIESQLESWYRFLIQPDPYAAIAVSDNGSLKDGIATWQGVDNVILQQRHDFLRPDSLVAIITLTDENDSEIDVRSFGGTSWKFMSDQYDPPAGTSQCVNPADPSCQSCGFCNPSTGQPAAICNDPNCTGPNSSYSNEEDWGFNTNLRHVHMKAKYGADPQFPIGRYVNGLTSAKVPDRNGEYPANGNGSYAGTNDCTNPLFAASLPDGSSTDAATLCNLPAGHRTADLVFFAHIGGVPNELLHFDPNSAKNSLLSPSDWVKILGNDPQSYDYSGIDPHMIESQTPRAGLAGPSGGNTDPINGREWVTNQGTGHRLDVDREYACIFPLAEPRDCSQAYNANACDCPVAATLTAEELPPVCDPNNQSSQIAAKAYPTIRELLLAKLMGTQGVVSSICPIHVNDESDGGTDPLYGYRPAISVIVNQLKTALASQCIPQSLTPAGDGSVPCLVLVTLPTAGATCDPKEGLSAPDPSVLTIFEQNQEAQWKANGGAASGKPDPATLTTCVMQELLGSDIVGGTCTGSANPGWCYVTGSAAGSCSQAILFGSGGPPTGSIINLQCIEANTALDGG